MGKKYGLIIINCIMMLLVMILYTESWVEKSMEQNYPVLGGAGEESTFIAALVLDRVETLYPLLACKRTELIVAKREDRFEMQQIKPVELLTMMEVENVGSSKSEREETKLEEIPDNNTAEELQSKEEAEEFPEPTEVPKEVVPTSFVPHTLQNKVDLQVLADYETLVQNFYTIDACAMVGSNLLSAKTLDEVDLRVTKNSEAPQILIYHTHSQEGFIDSIPGDDSTTIVGVGEHLSNILEEQYGYQVLHHTGKYDEETRNNAYSRALPEIVEILEENPSIEIVIDLHRDAVNDDYKLVMDMDGRPTARFMFFNGVSCTKNTGSISYLENPYQLENLAFSFQMKKAAEEYYPGLTRKNYIHGYRYNMHLLPRTTLIELGAQNNTLEEAMNACDPIAHILDMVLSGV